jgi:hypothetical protein
MKLHEWQTANKKEEGDTCASPSSYDRNKEESQMIADGWQKIWDKFAWRWIPPRKQKEYLQPECPVVSSTYVRL